MYMSLSSFCNSPSVSIKLISFVLTQQLYACLSYSKNVINIISPYRGALAKHKKQSTYMPTSPNLSKLSTLLALFLLFISTLLSEPLPAFVLVFVLIFVNIHVYL